MALRAGYYGVKRFLRDKLEAIAGTYDTTIKSLFPRSEEEILGAKNLLENKAVSKTIGGIIYVVNADGSITWSGTHESDGNIFQVIADKQKLPQGNYILTGCPSGGSDTTYNMGIVIFDSNNTQVGSGIDTGNGYAFTVPNGGSVSVYGPRSQSQNKTHTVSGTFYPMISFDGGDYVPYAMTNKALTDSAADQKTAINAIITAATGAADFAAFKTAMGAITPVTRSLSLTKEDITEEVKEVESEKTVTKKRTTKKTEEV